MTYVYVCIIECSYKRCSGISKCRSDRRRKALVINYQKEGHVRQFVRPSTNAGQYAGG